MNEADVRSLTSKEFPAHFVLIFHGGHLLTNRP